MAQRLGETCILIYDWTRNSWVLPLNVVASEEEKSILKTFGQETIEFIRKHHWTTGDGINIWSEFEERTFFVPSERYEDEQSHKSIQDKSLQQCLTEKLLTDTPQIVKSTTFTPIKEEKGHVSWDETIQVFDIEDKPSQDDWPIPRETSSNNNNLDLYQDGLILAQAISGLEFEIAALKEQLKMDIPDSVRKECLEELASNETILEEFTLKARETIPPPELLKSKKQLKREKKLKKDQREGVTKSNDKPSQETEYIKAEFSSRPEELLPYLAKNRLVKK
jgi:hypothetical protein